MVSRTDFVQRNALSFDVEHWHEAALLSESVNEPTDYVAESVSQVCSILDRHDVTATFFVVGELAREHPELVANLAAAGHELGSHGHVHESVSAFTPTSFRENLERSAAAIRDASGVRPAGFRAPNFSVTPETAWAFEALAESEFTYDSSVFPTSTPLYGVSDGPRNPYEVRPDRPFAATPVFDSAAASDGELIEVPVAVAGNRVPVPVAGGFYARVLPTAVLEWGIRWLNRRGLPATLYFHPWEFNTDVVTSAPRIDKRLVSFYGVDSLGSKLDRLLETFAFGPIDEVLSEQGFTPDEGTDPSRTSVPSGDDPPRPSDGRARVAAKDGRKPVAGGTHGAE